MFWQFYSTKAKSNLNNFKRLNCIPLQYLCFSSYNVENNTRWYKIICTFNFFFVDILINFSKFYDMQEQKAMMENEAIRKQVRI